ncbi:MAG: hypothetical protein LBG84_00460 [Treponema sp.]|jgi:hypothetical protein|nr:hypothetical protein [Treponema sp.]
MNTGKKAILFAVLVPHRDCLPALRAYRRALFAAGLAGARAFPPAAPLAPLSRPLTVEELRAAAAELRALLGGGIRAAGPAVPGENGAGLPRFFGLRLTAAPRSRPGNPGEEASAGAFPLPVLPPALPGIRWNHPFLAPAILAPGEDPPPDLPPAPEITFRAAALANLSLSPAPDGEEDYSFSWERGPLRWLPPGRP